MRRILHTIWFQWFSTTKVSIYQATFLPLSPIYEIWDIQNTLFIPGRSSVGNRFTETIWLRIESSYSMLSLTFPENGVL